ncbi:MAG: Tex-like N-terminal domain-containing protein, partial [Muribaculaceae bacterium]
MADIIETAARRLNLPVNKVRATAQLLASGATIPFISRYRKEVTGNLNEIEINNIQLEIERLTRLEERRDAIIEAIQQQDKLSDDLLQRINEASTAAELEDLYLPYRPKRRTRASIARDRGLEPLARMIMSDKGLPDPQATAERFVKGEVKSPDEALAGALDIIAEWI